MLFTFSNPIEYYPLTLRVHESILHGLHRQVNDQDGATSILTIESEGDFENALRQIFASNKTRRIVQAIYVESGGYSSAPFDANANQYQL
jgi:hypothetical protein